ncbi:hypothetical protein [uncultured Mediterranean phage]|nr:hypothetical protein [uncultured Mediterranean phage]
MKDKIKQIVNKIESGDLDYHDAEIELLDLFAVSGNFPSDDEIETAAIDYRDKSDDENTNEDTMMIETHWYDKQESFITGVKWFLENYANVVTGTPFIAIK